MRRIAPVVVAFVVLAALVAVKEAGSTSGAVDRGDIVRLTPKNFTIADIASIEVTAPGGAAPAYTIEKTGDTWFVTKPFKAPASVGAVTDLAKALSEADGELRSDDAAQFAEFHVTADRATTVRVVGTDGKVLAHVAVGRTSGTKGAFVRLLGEGGAAGALSTTKDLRGLLGLPRTSAGDAPPATPEASHFHDKTFPSIDLTTAKRLDVIAPGRTASFQRGERGWESVKDQNGNATLPAGALNAEGIQQILRTAGPEFRPAGLADPSDLAKLGLAEPKWTLAFTLDDGTVHRIFGSMGAEGGTDGDGKCYVRLDAKQGPDVVWECQAWEFERLFPKGSGLVSFESVPCPEKSLFRVILQPKDGPRIEVVRDGTKPADDWRVVSPAWGLAAKQQSLRNLTALVKNIRPIDWVDAADMGEVQATLRFGAKDGPDVSLTTVEIGGKGPTGKDRLARLPGAAGVRVLADSTVDRLVVDPLTLFETKILHGWFEADITALRAERREGDAWVPAWALAKDGDAWKLTRGGSTENGAAKDAKPAAVEAFIAKALAAEVKRLAGGDAAAPSMRLTFERLEGSPVVFAVSEPKDGKTVARVGHAAFEIDALAVSADGAAFE